MSSSKLTANDATYKVRKIKDLAIRGLCVLFTLLALVPLFSVLYYLTVRGIGGVNLAFFTELPKPVGEEGGGMANAIVGTLELVGLACLFGIPPGAMAGIYLAEFQESKLSRLVRFSADVLSGVPSITVGVFIYGIFVLTMKRFSMVAGAVALAVLMLPTVTRTTEELMRLVPVQLREAGLGLGLPRWRVTLKIIFRTALPGIVTGIMLAVARVAGETAPLLFTALSNRFWNDGIDQPVASLPVQIYTYAVSPFEDWHRQAWAAALMLVVFILILNVTARLMVRHRVKAR
ncbi:MAG: phosphate ABC transporter permease PstA [Polyangiaceae bacterium]|nr:phosphate ABC transporter permease PstA [Myxococcales bacterium]MCB9584046.1 phosphate ABC transporter permease PstA [Polyangiaceae bacterium]